MTMTTFDRPSRRTFLKSAAVAGGGLVIGLQLAWPARVQAGAAALEGPAGETLFAPNAFVRIAPDNTVTVLSKHIEMGQGPYTGLATLVAEELDADWAQIRVEAAPANPELYKNLAFGIQGTGGSSAIANSYEQMRQAGATARAMLVAAAADQWGVPASEITVAKGVVSHAGSNRKATFGSLAEPAAAMTPPTEVALKDPKDFVLIGTDRPKVDSRIKVNGQAKYTLDVQRPGMLTVLLARPPRFGGKVATLDDAAARAIKGVVEVKAIGSGVAVYAQNFWAAKKGRDALQVTWDDSAAEQRSSATLIERYQALAKTPGRPAASHGDSKAALAAGSTVLEADYAFPFLAHSPLEPNNCVIELGEGRADAWFGSQLQTVDQGAIAAVLGLKPEQVAITTLLAGGSFGRRATPTGDIAVEAAEVAKAYGKTGVPLKLVWTREDDVKGGRYRPIYVHRLRGAIDAKGTITAWEQTIVGQSIIAGSPFEAMIKDGVDPTSVEGASDLPYAIPNLAVGLHTETVGVPVLWWRSVGHTHTGYAVETFLDELLEAGGQDPVAGRLALLKEQPRHAGVLRAVAELADWGGPVPAGRARGVAVHKSFDTYVAQIAEVSQDAEGNPRVHKVWCAVDCGVAVNPNIITAQMEGGIGFGLGAVLFGEITMQDGRIVQSNFDDYRMLRINEMPEVAVRIVTSSEPPTGVGEPGVPPLAPAVANAWAKLTGARVRRLPFLSAAV